MPVCQEVQSVGLVLRGLSGGVSGGECGVMEGQLEERPEFRIRFVRERSQRLVCMFHSHETVLQEVGSGGKLALEGSQPCLSGLAFGF